MDFRTLFATTARRPIGMSDREWQAENWRLYQRQTTIDAVLHGEQDEDVLYDMLAEHGINPHDWAEQAIENIGFVVGDRF